MPRNEICQVLDALRSELILLEARYNLLLKNMNLADHYELVPYKDWIELRFKTNKLPWVIKKEMFSIYLAALVKC